MTGMRVIDGDGHIFEDFEGIGKRLPEPWRSSPRGFNRDTITAPLDHLHVDVGITPPGSFDRRVGPKEWVDFMDDIGLEQAVLFPTAFLAFGRLPYPEYAIATSRAYNDWLAEYCAEAPDRMFGAGMLAPHDIEGSVLEARRCVEELGFKAVFLAPGCVNRRPWHHPAYDPLWEEIQRLDVPIAFHGGGQTYLRPDFSLELFDRLMMWHTFNQPLGIQFATVSLCAGGVLERFPDLRVALLEGNCSWAPWLLHRLDEHYEWTGWYEATDLTMKPSDYFRRNCFLGVEADEDTAIHYVDWFGADNLVFSTDYPHGDSAYPHAVDGFEKLDIPFDAKVRILGENWSRLYKIPLVEKAPR